MSSSPGAVVWIGVLVLALNLLSKYLRFISVFIVRVVCPKSSKELEVLEKYNNSKDDLTKISMVDEFPKFARTKRNLSKMKEELQSFGKGRATTRTKINMGIQSVYYVVYLVCLISIMVTYRDVPLVKLPVQWLWPLAWPISFPSGVPGGVGVAFWLFVTNQVSSTIKSVFYQ